MAANQKYLTSYDLKTNNQEFNGEVYVKGIGGYDGTNPSQSQSLKDVIGDYVEKEVTETLSVNFVGTGAIYAVDYEGHLGEVHTSTNSQYSDYVDISNHSVLSLNYLRMKADCFTSERT